MKNLLHITTSLNIGGAENFLYNLINNNLKDNFNCAVITLKSGGVYHRKIEEMGVEVISLNMNRGYLSLSSIFRFYKYCKSIKPDIIQGWMYHGNFFAFIYKIFFLKKIPILWNIRASLYDVRKERYNTRIVIFLSKILSPLVDIIIYNSEISFLQHSKIGFSKTNSKIIHNGFDLNVWKPSLFIKEQIRNKFNINKSNIIVGFAARYHPMKDISNFLSAMKIVLKEKSNVNLIMVGEGLDEKFANDFSLYKKFPNKKFILLGPVENLHEIMPAFDILCLSSAWGEGFPNVIGQAMACENIAVSTKVGDVSKLINEDKRICEPKSPDKLAKIIMSIISMSNEERVQIGKANRKYIQNNFNLLDIKDKYLAVYRKLI